MNTRGIARVAVAPVVTVAMVAVGLGLATPGSAAPRESGAGLTVNRGDSNFTSVTMVAFYPMEQPDAQGYLNNVGSGGMEFLLYADDEGGNDPVKQRFWAPGTDRFPGYEISATSAGLSASLTVNLPNGMLNEDDGEDEFYIKATFVDGDGGRRSQFSNAVSGNWP